MALIELTLYNTHFILKLNNPNLKSIIDYACNRLVSYSYQYNKKIRRLTKIKDKNYFVYDNIRREYRFSIGVLRDVLLLLGNNNIKREHIDLFKPKLDYVKEIDINFNKKYILREQQNLYVNAVLNNGSESRLNIALIDAQSGFGKMQRDSTPVRTNKGWIPIGDIKVGDKVLGSNGNYCNVVGVTHHGVKDIYKITFYDGRSTTCGEEHLWGVYSRYFDGWYKVVPTKYLIELYKKPSVQQEPRFYIPLVKPENSPPKDYIIDPYVLGVLIGDGCITHGVGIANYDDEVLDRVESKLIKGYNLNRKIGYYKDIGSKTGYRHKKAQSIVLDKTFPHSKPYANIYKAELIRLNLFGKTALKKFIPEEYMNGSTEQRWELIRGLMDTDGTVSNPAKQLGRNGKPSKSGTISYATSSKELADNVRQLVFSLGDICSMYVKQPYYTYRGKRYKGNLSYILTIRAKFPRLYFTRKRCGLDRLASINQYSNNLKLRINKIEYIGKDKCTCIAVDSVDRLYVCENYIVTHNSLMSSFLLSHYRKKFIIVVLAKYLDKWVTDIQEYTDIKSEDIYIIQGLDSIKTLSKTKSSDLKYKCYIVSLTTTTYYFKRYEDCTLDTDIISPPKLMEHLGVGIMYNDETHQAFHAVYKCVLYFTVDKLIATSATLISNKSDESRLYKTLFPNDTRVSGLVKKSNHVNVKAISYALTNNKKVQHKSSQGYSHIIYEQFITRHSMFLRNYIEMIVYYFKEGYIDKRKEGDRALLYFSTVRMCHIIANTLKEYYPNLKIGTYVETDSYEDLMNNDVSVSTLISASTAVDIKNLIFVLNTISVSSAKSNLQSLGRLRNIEGRDLWYYYTYCVDIPSQIRLHKERESTIYSSTRMYLYERYRIPIRVR